MGKEMSGTMRSIYSHNSDQYKSFSNHQDPLLSTKTLSTEKDDTVVNSNFKQFSDSLTFEKKNDEDVDVRGNTSGEETGGGETTETESKHSDEEDWYAAPPDDYLEHVEVFNEIKIKVECSYNRATKWLALTLCVFLLLLMFLKIRRLMKK